MPSGSLRCASCRRGGCKYGSQAACDFVVIKHLIDRMSPSLCVINLWKMINSLLLSDLSGHSNRRLHMASQTMSCRPHVRLNDSKPWHCTQSGKHDATDECGSHNIKNEICSHAPGSSRTDSRVLKLRLPHGSGPRFLSLDMRKCNIPDARCRTRARGHARLCRRSNGSIAAEK